MTSLTVSLSSALTIYMEEQVAAGPYKTADDYIQALIQQDKARKEHLEPLILEGLASGEATPMTDFNLRRSPPTSEIPLSSLIGSASGSFETAEEADTFIRKDRDAWES